MATRDNAEVSDSSPTPENADAPPIPFGNDGLPQLPTTRGALRYLVSFTWRVVLPSVLIVVWFIAPLSPVISPGLLLALEILFLVLYAVLFGWYLRWQVQRIHRSGRPEVRWIESMIVLGVLFVSIFARLYRLLVIDDPGAFSEPMTVLNSYYYALTMLSTVGFGDVHAVSDQAKVFTMAQMVGNIAFVGLVVKVLAGAAAGARQRRSR